MFKTLFAEETEETRRLLGSMATEPVKEAVDPAREADNAPPTVLHGTLTVEVPGGETMVLKTTFDSGSNTDAVSEKVAMQLKKLGVPWGEAGGGVSMAVSSSVAVPHGELRLLLSAEPTGRDGREEEQLAIPRPLQFVTDALIMKDLSTDLIIGWPTLKGTGLLAIVLGLEEYELEEDKDDDGLGELWEASEDPTYGPPTVKGSAEEVQKLRTLCEEFKHLFGPPPSGGCGFSCVHGYTKGCGSQNLGRQNLAPTAEGHPVGVSGRSWAHFDANWCGLDAGTTTVCARVDPGGRRPETRACCENCHLATPKSIFRTHRR